MSENKNEEVVWKKIEKIKQMGSLAPVLKTLLLVVEAEKERTLAQIENVKNTLETMKKNKKHE